VDRLNPLSDFFSASRHDGRIALCHIGLFAVLLEMWLENGCENPIVGYSHEILIKARISSRATYHRCIRDLHDFGYINYEPSYKRNKRSKIYLKTAI
jgi:hypothetical protein